MGRPRELASSIGMFPARTPTLPPATHTNSYALGGRDVLLVEPATPYDYERRAWVAWARGLASSGRQPLAIFVTHHHIDHIGGAAFLAKELGLPLWAHEETAARIHAPVARRLAEGDLLVLEGPRDEAWRVLLTPGHAPGHLCLFEERTRTLVVGDMVASVGTILIAPDDGDMREYLRQLDRLAALDATLALPAHGEPIDDPTTLFRHYIAHRLDREARVIRALTAGEADLATLVPLAYADKAPSIWPIARPSLEAHLDKLVQDGTVVRVGERYRLL